MGILSDAVAMLRVKYQMKSARVNLSPDQEDLRFCFHILEEVSRSFAMVIAQLSDAPLRDAICIFYLVLRGLDTIEDDMSIPIDVKVKELSVFHEHLEDAEWSISGMGEGKERELLEKFPCVVREYLKLSKEYRTTIADICQRMAAGMVEFLQRSVETKKDYDLYCHYVAGLVGHGLTRLFADCGFEDPHLADDLTNANHMGLFLQKTNIIRDYFEDIREEPPRVFWPKEIWGKHASEVAAFKDPANAEKGLACLNEMVSDVMVHLPFALDYLAALREPSVFRFCSIPQVMAIATLAEVYNNADTFQVKVKISKAAACHITLDATDLYRSLCMMEEYTQKIMDKTQHAADNDSTRTLVGQLEAALKLIRERKQRVEPVPYVRSLLMSYPALGGRFLLRMVDNISGFFGGGSTAITA